MIRSMLTWRLRRKVRVSSKFVGSGFFMGSDICVPETNVTRNVTVVVERVGRRDEDKHEATRLNVSGSRTVVTDIPGLAELVVEVEVLDGTITSERIDENTLPTTMNLEPSLVVDIHESHGSNRCTHVRNDLGHRSMIIANLLQILDKKHGPRVTVGCIGGTAGEDLKTGDDAVGGDLATNAFSFTGSLGDSIENFTAAIPVEFSIVNLNQRPLLLRQTVANNSANSGSKLAARQATTTETPRPGLGFLAVDHRGQNVPLVELGVPDEGLSGCSNGPWKSWKNPGGCWQI